LARPAVAWCRVRAGGVVQPQRPGGALLGLPQAGDRLGEGGQPED
jgi:hypothetical protein